MKRTSLIIIAVLLLLIWPIWWLTQHRPFLGAVNASAQHAKVPAPTANAVAQNPTSTPASEHKAEAPAETQQQYLEKARSIGKNLNHPARFYGLILDQNNQPVADVTIKCGLSQFSDIVRPGLAPHYNEFERTTNTAGRFAVVGQSGLALDMTLRQKPGYEFKPAGLQVVLRDQGLKNSTSTLSTPNTPYVFRAFRKGRAEPLFKGEIAFYDCEPDGRSYIVQLENGRIIEGTTGGDFRISVQRPPGWSNQTDYDWTVRIDAVSMEFVETHDVFMYQAPTSGYESTWEFSKKAGEGEYTREADPKFYLKTRDSAAYGRMEMKVKSDSREKSAILIYFWLNLSGSRNLEFDPLQKVVR